MSRLNWSDRFCGGCRRLRAAWSNYLLYQPFVSRWRTPSHHPSPLRCSTKEIMIGQVGDLNKGEQKNYMRQTCSNLIRNIPIKSSAAWKIFHLFCLKGGRRWGWAEDHPVKRRLTVLLVCFCWGFSVLGEVVACLAFGWSFSTPTHLLRLSLGSSNQKIPSLPHLPCSLQSHKYAIILETGLDLFVLPASKWKMETRGP